MLIADASFHDPHGLAMLLEAFQTWIPAPQEAPVFICIGSDRHILDCFGPLIGTMLNTSLPQLTVYGTLDQPLHARNLIKEMQWIRLKHPGQFQLAIDASVGDEDEIGQIQLRQGGLLPGRALYKNLPEVGDFSLTGIVDTRSHVRAGGNENKRGLAHVYHMARLVQEVILHWYRLAN